MDVSKVRGGQAIAAAGGIVLLISLLFLNWYQVQLVSVDTPLGGFSANGDFGAWDGQGFTGTIANLIMLAAGIAAVGLAVLTATSRTVALPVAASALTAGLGFAAVVMAVLRILFQPGPNGLVDLKFGIFLALIGAVAVAYGGWQSMQEEGTTFEQARDQLQGRVGDGPERAPGAPAARPTPTSAPEERPGEKPDGTSVPPPGTQ
jgi:hypothetical protein